MVDAPSEDGAASDGDDRSGTDAPTEDDPVRVWLVERTYSDDEQNLIILVYATPDGERYHRRERALTSFSDERATSAALDVSPGDLGAVDDEDLTERYATEAERMAATHDPDDPI